MPQVLPKINTQQKPVIQVNPEMLLNRSEQATLIREMLHLPHDIKQALAIMQPITPEAIKQLLENNTKEVITKLVKLIQQTPDNPQNHEQLKYLISLLKQVTPAKNAPAQEVVTQFLLLYLPYLPLLENQKLEILFEKKQSGEQEDENASLIIYISTINLGRFKVTIFIDKIQNLSIHIQNTDMQEKDVLKTILKAIKSGLNSENIKADTNMTVVKQKDFTKSEKTEVTVAQANNLSPIIMTAAQKITEIILEMDKK